MDALIATFVDELKQRVAMYNEDPDGNLFNDVSSTEADGDNKNYPIILNHLLRLGCVSSICMDVCGGAGCMQF